MQSNSNIHSISWRSSYAGNHDFNVVRRDGSTFRVTAAVGAASRFSMAHLTDDQYERDVEGKVGLYTALSPENLSLEFAATFAAHCYQEHCKSVEKMKAKPEFYRDYIAEPHTVYLPAIYECGVGFKPLFTFKEIIAAAGIPADKCRCAYIR